MSNLKKYASRIGEMSKVVTIEEMEVLHRTKDVYDSDVTDVIAFKIARNFSIGDKVKIYGSEGVYFRYSACPIRIPEDMACEIVGAVGGYFVMYPKGYLITLKLVNEDHRDREFMSEIGVDNEGKYYYNIWRSK